MSALNPSALTAKDLERFWGKVDKATAPNGCWTWRGALNPEGRGRFTAQGISTYAYRWAWVIVRGPLTKRDVIRHRCRNPACVRVAPGHLEIGDYRANNLDTAEDGQHRSAKLDPTSVRRIRERLASGDRPRYVDLAREYGVTVSTVSEVALGKSWPRVGGPVLAPAVRSRGDTKGVNPSKDLAPPNDRPG